MNNTTPHLQAALLCEGITTDEHGRHTIYNEFSQCTMGYSQPFTILTIWRGGNSTSNQDYKEQIEIVAPDGRVIASGENGPFSLQNNTYRQINSILLEGIDFTNDGIYEVQVKLFNSHDSIIEHYCEPIIVI